MGVTIHDGTDVGSGCVIEDGVVLGKPRHVPARQVGTVDDAQLLERWR